MAVFVIKTGIDNPGAKSFEFRRQKTMYGGRRIGVGDTIYLFASETHGGGGLIARGIVTAAAAVARRAGVARQTPRVHVTVKRMAMATRRLGRLELKPFCAWKDGKPETELNFKFYRQATDKIGGVSEQAAAFLDSCFSARPTRKPRPSRATRRAESRSR